jgi:hypothetical protein
MYAGACPGRGASALRYSGVVAGPSSRSGDGDSSGSSRAFSRLRRCFSSCFAFLSSSFLRFSKS